jgi:hypothetical protein
MVPFVWDVALDPVIIGFQRLELTYCFVSSIYPTQRPEEF